MNPSILLSDAEFADRKRTLLLEKDKLTQQLSQLDTNNCEWAEIAKDSFDFALLAAERFAEDNPMNKKVIFTTIGSNPILLDQKVEFQLRYVFFKYKEGIKRTNEEISRLVPTNCLSDQANLQNFLKSSVWCG